jgi:hypothetical protein
MDQNNICFVLDEFQGLIININDLIKWIINAIHQRISFSISKQLLPRTDYIPIEQYFSGTSLLLLSKHVELIYNYNYPIACQVCRLF